jgi:hypothetical protein
MMLAAGHLAFEGHLAAGIDRCYDVSSCFMLNSWAMPILKKILDIISPNSPTIPGYPRCLGMTGQWIMSRQDRQLASVDHGSGLASEAHGTRPSGLRTGSLSKSSHLSNHPKSFIKLLKSNCHS